MPALQQSGDETGRGVGRAARVGLVRGHAVTVGLADRVTLVAQVDNPAAPHRAGRQRQAQLGGRIAEYRDGRDVAGRLGRQRVVEADAWDRNGADDVHHSGALRVASEHLPSAGAVFGHPLDVGAGVVGAVSCGQEVVRRRVDDGIGPDGPAADLLAQLVDERPADRHAHRAILS